MSSFRCGRIAQISLDLMTAWAPSLTLYFPAWVTVTRDVLARSLSVPLNRYLIITHSRCKIPQSELKIIHNTQLDRGPVDPENNTTVI